MLLETSSRLEDRYAPEDADARRNLVKRIVASSTFARSNRLSDFLKYVYALAEKGRFDDIHEQNIGAAVFGRMRDYDPTADSIVRSHASRLRHRLRTYFEEEGQDEPFILSIPRGSYIPVFATRLPHKPAGETDTATAQAIKTSALESDEGVPFADNFFGSEVTPASVVELDARKKIVQLRSALLVAVAVIAALIIFMFAAKPFAARTQQEDISNQNPLWKEFLSKAGEKTVVVSSDSGLVMYQHLTGQPVTLASYLTGDYLKNTTSPLVPAEIVRKFGTRRYTPAVDLSMLERLTRIFGGKRDRLSFRYARDLRIEDLKQGNAVLLGSAESNPWVQLYEPSLNFHFEDDLLHDRSQMINRHPLPGEALHYDSTPQDPTPTVYGVVAYRASLHTSGRVLILEGQTMAGTQTAADFVFDDSYLLPFLKKIRRRDGTVPNFEVLLRSSSFAGQSARLEIIAYRIE